MKYSLTVALLHFCLLACTTNAPSDNSKLKDSIQHAYLGHKPPGMIPVPFAPKTVSTPEYQYGGMFTQDMKEYYFIRGKEGNTKQEFVSLQLKDNKWVEKEVSPRLGQPFFSPDGKTMHLGNRYKEKTNTGWSSIKTLPAPLDDFYIMRLTVSAKGTYFFDTYDENNPDFPIRYSRLIDGKHEKPQVLSEAINTGTYLSHPFIAPDESYLLWDAKREDGYGDSDLYVSFKQPDGQWGEALNLGDKINTEAWDAAASVSPDGKYLFFHRLLKEGNEDTLPDVDIFWVDAKVIEDLRPHK